MDDGYYTEHFVTQHDILRDLAIYQTSVESIEKRKRVIIDMCGDDFPEWWTEQMCQFNARFLSISTGCCIFFFCGKFANTHKGAHTYIYINTN